MSANAEVAIKGAIPKAVSNATVVNFFFSIYPYCVIYHTLSISNFMYDNIFSLLSFYKGAQSA